MTASATNSTRAQHDSAKKRHPLNKPCSRAYRQVRKAGRSDDALAQWTYLPVSEEVPSIVWLRCASVKRRLRLIDLFLSCIPSVRIHFTTRRGCLGAQTSTECPAMSFTLQLTTSEPDPATPPLVRFKISTAANKSLHENSTHYTSVAQCHCD